jgi:hypothetical protein
MIRAGSAILTATVKQGSPARCHGVGQPIVTLLDCCFAIHWMVSANLLFY